MATKAELEQQLEEAQAEIECLKAQSGDVNVDPKAALKSALGAYLAAHGCDDPNASAQVLRQLASVARYSTQFPQSVVQALIRLDA